MDTNHYQEMYNVAVNEEQDDAVIEKIVNDFKDECVREIVDELNTISLFITKGERKRHDLAERLFVRAWSESDGYDDSFNRAYNKMWEEYEAFSELLSIAGYDY